MLEELVQAWVGQNVSLCNVCETIFFASGKKIKAVAVTAAAGLQNPFLTRRLD